MAISNDVPRLGRRFQTFRYRFVRSVAGWLTPRRLKIYPASIALITWGGWLFSLWRGKGILDAFSQVIGNDFMAFYMAGRFLLDGRLTEMYDLTAQRAFQESLGVQVQTIGFHPFVNPPFAALLYAPFAANDYLSGLILWWLAGAICFVFAIVLLHGELKGIWAGVATPSWVSIFWAAGFSMPSLFTRPWHGLPMGRLRVFCC